MLPGLCLFHQHAENEVKLRVISATRERLVYGVKIPVGSIRVLPVECIVAGFLVRLYAVLHQTLETSIDAIRTTTFFRHGKVSAHKIFQTGRISLSTARAAFIFKYDTRVIPSFQDCCARGNHATLEEQMNIPKGLKKISTRFNRALKLGRSR
jgi:hypothetical protein